MITVKTKIIKVDTNLIERDKLKVIIEVLRRGGIVAYPTDTFYGLGANCFIKEAIQKIYRLKKRKPSKPISIVVSDLEMAKRLVVDIPPVFNSLAKKFWPGPLTLVLKASPTLPKKLLSIKDSIGIRIPDSPWLRELIKAADFPVSATSANISGEEEISEYKEIIRNFFRRIDLIVDGGKTPGILPSTVVDLSSIEPKILREGALPSSMLRKYLK